MDMGLEIGILLAYAFGMLILYFLGYFLLIPAKILGKLLINSVLGGVTIFLINWVGQGWDFHIPLNLLSAMIVGFLGLPGILLLLFL